MLVEFVAAGTCPQAGQPHSAADVLPLLRPAASHPPCTPTALQPSHPAWLPAGALAAVAVGWGTLGASFRGGLTLLAFFFASSALTRYKDELKAVDEEHKAGGQRDWRQVRMWAGAQGGGHSATDGRCNIELGASVDG